MSLDYSAESLVQSLVPNERTLAYENLLEWETHSRWKLHQLQFSVVRNSRAIHQATRNAHKFKTERWRRDTLSFISLIALARRGTIPALAGIPRDVWRYHIAQRSLTRVDHVKRESK